MFGKFDSCFDIVIQLQCGCKNIEIPIITVILAVTVTLNIGNNRQV